MSVGANNSVRGGQRGPWIAVTSAAKTYALPESLLYRLTRADRLASRRYRIGRRMALVISESDLLRIAFADTTQDRATTGVAR